MDTFNKVAELLAEHKGIDISEIKPESTFEELKVDSLDVAELVMAFEDEFEISIEIDQEVKTVKDMVARIEEAKA
ncbi:MAG TPA: acyl carrier protein [Candidatus Pullichristensenella excrementigallinarum]|uniref:Acyl carrier protein n=1 Tax=Candidatus Pullichristensenella excrementigallinarum TaxID=2840907 RepID=A0A9D1LDM3_9FIRM|nr:acyl carrier protein [Candidatus Pullichristensenella excrementigallinarum]